MEFSNFEEQIGSFLESLEAIRIDHIDEDYAPIIPSGTVCRIGGMEYIVLASFRDGTSAVITKNFVETSEFDSSSANWATSSLREWLHDSFYMELARIVGRENIIQTRRNLISLDGLTNYGEVYDSVSLLTAHEYAMYRKVLGEDTRYGDWWWLLTPWSPVQYSRCVCCADSDGTVSCSDCGDRNGVRPFCILNSSILSL